MENTVDAVLEEVVVPQNEQAEAEVEVQQAESVEPEVAADTQADTEKHVQSKEENAKYAELRRKYEAEKAEEVQKAKDKVIADMYGESHGIHTEAEYKEAMQKQREREEIEKITQKGVSEADAKEILEARRVMEEAERMKAEMETEKQQKERATKENQDFLDYFKVENGRDYDPDKDTVPDEVWKKNSEGIPLKYAFMEHQLEQIRLGKETQQKNLENAEASIGKISADGNLDTDFISESVFEKNKTDRRWVMDNLEKITKSRTKW